ncbi:MAG: hypothetical protein WAW91_01880 [Candidatus Nanoperiomorbaceae bacterium]
MATIKGATKLKFVLSRHWRDDRGAAGVFIFGMIFFMLVAVGVGIWGYTQMQKATTAANSRLSYAKQVSDQAVTKAVAAQQDKDAADKVAALKQPFSTFAAPAVFGSVNFQYPKTWSQFVQSNSGGNFAAYFYPLAVPPVNTDTAYALRVVITSQPYTQVLQQNQGLVQQGKLTATTLNTGIGSAAKGMLLQGQFSDKINGLGAFFPVLNGNYTLEIFADDQNFFDDYNNTILPSLKYDL